MSLQALAQEKFWANKAECEDAEKAYQMRLSGAKGSSPSSLAAEIAKARQHIKNSLECVDGIAAMAGGANADVLKKLKDLEIENKNLKKVTDDLKSMVLKLENRVAALEGGKAAPAAKAPAKDMLEDVEDHNINYRDDIGLGDEKLVTLSTKDLNKMLKKRGISKDRAKEIKRERRTLQEKKPAKEEEDDDDVDLFGSESEEEEDAEKDKVRQERLAAYAAKKAKKPALIAKTSVLLDVKPWDDETDMDAMLKSVKSIEMEGLLWGASKLVPVGYGINKLSIVCVVEDEKVSIDELQEKIQDFEDFVQSCDVASMQKI